MAVSARVKGQFVQAGTILIFPVVAGDQIANHDGTLEMDTVYLQADYPILFEVIGIQYNDPGKGDDNGTQFRTPPSPTWLTDTNYRCRIRY